MGCCGGLTTGMKRAQMDRRIQRVQKKQYEVEETECEVLQE